MPARLLRLLAVGARASTSCSECNLILSLSAWAAFTSNLLGGFRARERYSWRAVLEAQTFSYVHDLIGG